MKYQSIERNSNRYRNGDLSVNRSMNLNSDYTPGLSTILKSSDKSTDADSLSKKI